MYGSWTHCAGSNLVFVSIVAADTHTGHPSHNIDAIPIVPHEFHKTVVTYEANMRFNQVNGVARRH